MTHKLNRRQALTGSGVALAGCLPTFQANAWSKDITKNAFSLHIGVNQHLKDAYPEGIAKLAGCASDANVCLKIARKMGFQKSMVLPDDKATIQEVRRHVYHAASHLNKGDIFFVSFAGHGTQVTSSSGDKTNRGSNNAWCLYDGLMLDDYLYFLWSKFKSGVRILVVADTCYTRSTTRVRESARAIGFDLANKSGLSITGNFASADDAKSCLPQLGVLEKFGDLGIYAQSELVDVRPRTISAKQADAAYQFPGSKAEYDRQDSEARATRMSKPILASGILLAGCQDTEISYENSSADHGGFFTKALDIAFSSMPAKVLPNNANFNSYSAFLNYISTTMPSYQQPRYVLFGEDDDTFSLMQPPFTV